MLRYNKIHPCYFSDRKQIIAALSTGPDLLAKEVMAHLLLYCDVRHPTDW